MPDIITDHYRGGDVIIADDFFAGHLTAWSDRRVLFIKAIEHNKTMGTVINLIDSLPAGFSKSNRLLVVGGGITQDVGGFLAAIYKRGIPASSSQPPCSP